MLKNFQKYSFSSIYITVIIAVLIWLGSFINPITNNTEVYYSDLAQLFNHWINLLGKGKIFLAFIIILSQAAMLASFSNKFKTFGKNTFLAGIIYIILTAPHDVQTFNPVIIANIFVIWSLGILLKSIEKKKATTNFFSVAILMAIASLIYPQYVLITLFTLAATLVVRSKLTKEFFAVILGFILIYALYAEIYFLTQGSWAEIKSFTQIFENKAIKYIQNWYFLAFFGFYSIVFMISSANILKNIGYKEIDKRTIFQLIFTFFIFTIITYLIIPSVGINFFATIAIPLTFLFGDFFADLKPKLSNRIIFWLFIAFGFTFYAENIISLFE
ncbi:MAG: hypothetical protein JXL97_07930 [Bacteroidales bacterium]|nr:hypothetical protein [Bacteroidales bacterium]